MTTLHSKLPLKISDQSFHQNIMVTDDFDLIKPFYRIFTNHMVTAYTSEVECKSLFICC